MYSIQRNVFAMKTPPKRKPITVSLSTEVYDVINTKADALGVTVPAYVKMLTIGHATPGALRAFIKRKPL